MECRAQSEVIGIVLLIAVIVLGVTTTGVFLLQNQQRDIASEKPTVDFGSDLTDSNATITHRGGRSIPLSDLDLILRNDGSERVYDLDDPADRKSIDDDGDGDFEAGESVSVNHPFTGEVRVILVDTSDPGHVLYDETKTVVETGPIEEPTIEKFEITDTSDDLNASFDVTWNASDDQGDITEVKVELIKDGTVEDSATTSFSGVAKTGENTDTLENKSGSGTSYKIKLTVTDTVGNTATDSKVANANSDVGLRSPVIETFDVTDQSSGQDAIYDVTHNASDPDGDIIELNVTLIDESAGTVVDDANYSFNQVATTGEKTDTLSDTTGKNKRDTYRINISVKDTEGNVADDTVTDAADGGGGGGGGGVDPTIDTFDVTDVSTCGNTAEYDVSWAVSDGDDNLNSVTLELIATKNNNVVDSQSIAVSGGSASGTDTLSKNGGCSKEYKIKITVDDTNGNTATDSVTDTAGQPN